MLEVPFEVMVFAGSFFGGALTGSLAFLGSYLKNFVSDGGWPRLTSA